MIPVHLINVATSQHCKSKVITALEYIASTLLIIFLFQCVLKHHGMFIQPALKVLPEGYFPSLIMVRDEQWPSCNDCFRTKVAKMSVKLLNYSSTQSWIKPIGIRVLCYLWVRTWIMLTPLIWFKSSFVHSRLPKPQVLHYCPTQLTLTSSLMLCQSATHNAHLFKCVIYINGLMQERCNSIAN